MGAKGLIGEFLSGAGEVVQEVATSAIDEQRTLRLAKVREGYEIAREDRGVVRAEKVRGEEHTYQAGLLTAAQKRQDERLGEQRTYTETQQDELTASTRKYDAKLLKERQAYAETQLKERDKRQDKQLSDARAQGLELKKIGTGGNRFRMGDRIVVFGEEGQITVLNIVDGTSEDFNSLADMAAAEESSAETTAYATDLFEDLYGGTFTKSQIDLSRFGGSKKLAISTIALMKKEGVLETEIIQHMMSKDAAPYVSTSPIENRLPNVEKFEADAIITDQASGRRFRNSDGAWVEETATPSGSAAPAPTTPTTQAEAPTPQAPTTAPTTQREAEARIAQIEQELAAIPSTAFTQALPTTEQVDATRRRLALQAELARIKAAITPAPTGRQRGPRSRAGELYGVGQPAQN